MASNGFGREAASLLWDNEFEVVAAASPNGGVGSILARSRPDVVPTTRGVRVTGPCGLTSASTVNTHQRNAFQKLGAGVRVETALIAVECGLA